ncbi:precorrin-6y C5,15-methyltransferase (decarboxylating) subunit CbiE [Phytohalomonas tamaricis]|uniref:precorrin-6y C5,15-methyltransferase (decarboxylating) subunit CbiE n=1 Tax=Phytohalomonas tamaricis TaxID=2081032 RepID=UPI000D0AE410|nr:precorrin-6y C5,15-methyltransferase (decarboxylating) subunit CbiE [Phytohalomonas tamaricis]
MKDATVKDVVVKSPAMTIDVVSLGIGEHAVLGDAALHALRAARHIVASPRQHATLDHLALCAQRHALPSPLSQLPALCGALEGAIVILASGDGLFFGIGTMLKRYYQAEALRFHPNVSSVQAMVHALGLDLTDLQTVSLHGRPLETLNAYLRHNRRYALLTDERSHPGAIARLLVEAGFVDSTLWVGERLGYPDQRLRQFTAHDIADDSLDVDPLNVVVVETRGDGGVLPEFPGILDAHFHTDRNESPGRGMLTKREVRLMILSLIAPRAGDIGWDIGAGCGGVAVEWARWNSRGQVHAIEHHPQRVEALLKNRAKFGVINNLTVHEARAPECLDALPVPSVVFVGGSDGRLAAILDQCWERLPVGGRLVASAVTEPTRSALFNFETRSRVEGEWTQLAVSRGERLAGQRLFRPQLPVTLVKFVKQEERR